MRSYIRKVKTSSGAIAVQIEHKRGRERVGIDHVGSAHTDAELEVLLSVARERLRENQLSLDLFPDEKPDLYMEGSHSELLWNTLGAVYGRLGFDALGDAVFEKLVLARIVEPTSKLDTIRVLTGLGVDAPSNTGIHRCLAACVEKDYRGELSERCLAAARPESLSLLLYDVTTLYFEVQREDGYRKPGMSKERRLEPQITVGLLVSRDGFPLEVRSFEGNRAEVKTVMEVLRGFKERHGLAEITITADAAMLSSANVRELEEMGYHYIIGSRISKVPYEIEEYAKKPGQALDDGQVFDLEVAMNTGRGTARVKRRVVYQYREKRAKMDLMNIDKAVDKAQRMLEGKADFKRNRFLTVKGGEKVLNADLVEKSKLKAGIKGYVTDLDIPAEEVISAYHQLFQVEKSFRMSKSDLKARPIFHRKRDSIEAHLTIVFAALAVSRRIEDMTGLSIRKVIKTLEPLRTGIVSVNGSMHRIPPRVTPEAKSILESLGLDESMH